VAFYFLLVVVCALLTVVISRALVLVENRHP